MSLFSDDYDEMQTQPLMDEQTMESILAGRSPSGRPELDELASFVTEVRSVASAPPPKVGAELAAVLAGGLSTDKGDLSATDLQQGHLRVGRVFVAEIGDVHRFRSPAALCSWAGLTPLHGNPTPRCTADASPNRHRAWV
jgi:hypothetical protein